MELQNFIFTSGFFSSAISWVTTHYIELIATITGLIYLYYSIKGDKLLWLFGLITSLLYVYICFNAGIYADMGINIYYVLVSIYGWVHWTLYDSEKKKEIPISKTKLKEYLILFLATIVFYVIIAYILVNYTDSDIPYWDAFTTSASITATWMLARKMLEHWIIWIVVDFLSIGMYIYKDLYPTSFLFFVYTIMAIIGYLQWKKQWRIQETK